MGSDMTSHFLRGGKRRGSAKRRFRRGDVVRREPVSNDVRLTLAARPESLPVIRHVIGAFGEALRLPPDMLEDVRLAVTEACTNVVRHAYDGEGGPINIVVRPDREQLEVIVSDHGRGMGPSPDIDGPGLGLPLIAALADAVEIQAAPVHGSRLRMSFSCRPRLGVA
jgi:serine/threonine-protein kinase RsbW